MALPIPTIKQIQAQIIADIEAETGQSVPILKKAVFRIMAFAFAGAWIILYKYGTDQFKQRFVQTANSFWLPLLGELVNIFRQSSTTWEGEAEVISTTSSGTLNAGTQLVNNNTGIVYSVKQSVALFVGTVTFTLRALEGGAIGNLEIADVIDFVSPQPGLDNTATTSQIDTPGEDQEDLEVYRQRVLNEYQKKPQGGALADYQSWSLEAANVINAFPYADPTPGLVNVYIEVDNQVDGIPTASQLLAVEDSINFDPITGRADRRPVTAEVTARAITRVLFTVEVIGLSPDTVDNRTAIDSAIQELFSQKEPFIQGLSITRKDSITAAETTSIVQQVAAALGATISSVNTKLLGSGINLYILGEGEMAKVTIPLTYL